MTRLMARLDRLGPAKEVAQVGAVIGSEFSYELAARGPSDRRRGSAARAAQSGRRGTALRARHCARSATYQFKHALIRDAAYEALLKSRRKELHRLVARTIDEKFPALKETHPEVLARHWTEAGETEPAIAEWSRAGRERRGAQRVQRSAGELLSRLWRCSTLLPESPERDQRELELRQSVWLMPYVTKGYRCRLETIDARARALCREESANSSTLSVTSRGSHRL